MILINNKVSKWIYRGLISEGFNKNNIYQIYGFEKAKELLANILKPGDIVLFENDLPDNLEFKK